MRLPALIRSVVLAAACATVAAASAIVLRNLEPFSDPTGAVATYNVNGDIDESGSFFQSLGTNGRSCGSCHRADEAMSLSGAGVRRIYAQTHGQDPLFQPVDGANCSTDDGREASSHSLLLEKGLIRIGLTVPQNPEFTLSVVHDPYGCAVTFNSNTGAEVVSVYRRPLPTTNLRFLSTIMFDGRDTVQPLNNASTFLANLKTDLTQQALEAIQIHGQATTVPAADQLSAIVNFELGLSTAQTYSDRVGSLQSYGANGGPLALANLPYYPGTNDSLGADPRGAPFRSSSMTLFDAWNKASTKRGIVNDRLSITGQERGDVMAGEKLFNTAVATITDVRGLNDSPSLGSPMVLKGTCTTCHDTPNVGNHSFPLPLDIATSRQAHFESNPSIIAGLAKLSPPDLPVYEIGGCPDTEHPGSTTVFYTSDPGKALITGKCSDVNRGKGPILRGLAARAPYFHNGAAENLQQLVDFYSERFQMNLTDKEKRQLIAFLNSL